MIDAGLFRERRRALASHREPTLRRLGTTLLALATLGLGPRALADSPLFSADISSAYSELPAVAHAAEAGLDANTCAVLANAAVSSDVRAAVIQAASKKSDSGAALTFFRYLAALKGKPLPELAEADLSTHELFALGYLLALDAQQPLGSVAAQNPTLSDAPSKLVHAGAIEVLEAVQGRTPEDFSSALVLALARGNRIMAEDFCQVYLEVEAVTSRGLKVNLRQKALDNVLAYISLYKEDCAEKQARKGARKLEPLRTVESKSTARMSFDAQGRILGAGSQDTALRIYSSRDGSLLQKIDTGEFTDRPRWLEGGRLLAFGDWKPALHLYDGTTFKQIFAQPLPARANAVALVEEPSATGPARKLLAAGLFDGQIALHALEDGQLIRSFKAHEQYVSSIVVTEDHQLVTGSFDASVAVFDLAGKLLRRTKWPAGSFVSEAGKLVLVHDFGDHWRMLDPLSGVAQGPPVSLPATLHDAAAHPSRPVIAAALSSGVVSFFDSKDGRSIFDLHAHDDQVLSVDFSADGALLLTGSIDGTFRLWNTAEILGKP